MSNPTPRRRSGRPAAFTLIEILVVVAIITILAGLLFAALRNVRASTGAASCGNNLQQIAHAMTHYRTDTSRYFGLHTDDGINKLSPLFDYIDNFDMLTCPATTNFLEIDRDDRAAAEAKLDDVPALTTDTEGKSYEARGRFSGGKIMTTHTIRGFEEDTWFLWDNDFPGEDQKLSEEDNHGKVGANALNANMAVVWVQGAVWEATVMGQNNQNNAD